MLSTRLRCALILLGLLLLPIAAGAQNDVGYAYLADWRTAEITWADMGRLPRDSEFTAPLTASYNLGYGATVLGLNLRGGALGDEYYATVASCVNGQLTSYDSLGPFTAPAQWNSGPYHVAAGLPDGRLMVWLTAPNEYPRRNLIANDYQPGTPFCCTVLPAAGLGNNWVAWQIDAAFLVDERILAVGTYDGLGRFTGGPELLDTDYGISWISQRQLPLADYWTPGVVYANHMGVYFVWHDQTRGWQRDALGDSALINVRLWLSPEPAPPLGLVLYVDGADAFAQPTLHEMTVNTASGRYATARWGNSTALPAEYNHPLTAFIDAASAVWPLIAQATDGNIYLTYHRPDPEGRVLLPFASAMLRFGDRSITGATEAYPIIGVTGAAHWKTGDPQIFWVQLGGGSQAGAGVLFRLSYEPEKAD